MIVGIGTDIVEVDRIAKLVKRNERFVSRILNESELHIYQQKKNAVSYLAKRWAAKEAIAKALGTGIAKGISFRHIEVLNDSNGKPTVKLSDRALKVANHLGVDSWHISISDEKNYALCFVIAEA